ncbi:MAG: hypothetical protein LBE58_02610 [Comamonas sp.]|jgi:hypothetical protein|nr:hypothetical protein [Comamonas sp.]
MPIPKHSTPVSRASRQSGQIMTEYLIVAGVLAAVFFAPMPGADKSLFQLLIDAFRAAWASYSYTISLPW